jgi:hypothetical protein
MKANKDRIKKTKSGRKAANAKVSIKPATKTIVTKDDLSTHKAGTISYADMILHPEHNHHAQVPGQYSRATIPVTRRITIPFTTNALGFASIFYDPQTLHDNTFAATQGCIYVNTVATYDANTVFGAGWSPQAVSYQLPVDNANGYRIVSAGMHVVPQSSMLNATGKITTAIMPAVTMVNGTIGVPVLVNSQLGVLTNLNNATINATADICQRQSARVCWLPYDSSSYEIFPPNSNTFTNEPLHNVNYITAIVSGSVNQNFNAEFYLNYELVAKPGSVLCGMDTVCKSNELPQIVLNKINQKSNQLCGSYMDHGEYSPKTDWLRTAFMNQALQKYYSQQR